MAVLIALLGSFNADILGARTTAPMLPRTVLPPILSLCHPAFTHVPRFLGHAVELPTGSAQETSGEYTLLEEYALG